MRAIGKSLVLTFVATWVLWVWVIRQNGAPGPLNVSPALAGLGGLASAALLHAGADTNHQSFPFYTLQVMAYSIALACLYWRTGGSVLLTMLMHSAFNNMKDLVPSAGAPAVSPFTLHATPVLRLTVLLLWVVSAVLLARMRGVAGARALTRCSPNAPIAPAPND